MTGVEVIFFVWSMFGALSSGVCSVETRFLRCEVITDRFACAAGLLADRRGGAAGVDCDALVAAALVDDVNK